MGTAEGRPAGLSPPPAVFGRSEPPASGNFDDGTLAVRAAAVEVAGIVRRWVGGRELGMATGTRRDLVITVDSGPLGGRGVTAGRCVRSGAV